ncbi:MAG: ATP-dependent sacrificial sulfur transferase LarE [Oscillospiraceae bacterium]|nr:ATP-dependent sacrificial sulfur transferase LarE [Oscillospiraceae bacterium]
MTLNEFFKDNPKAAIAFSGGVDSAYLLYAAAAAKANIRAYYVKSAFQPQFELDDAIKLAEELGADMKIINVDVLADSRVSANPADRCYYCKKAIFNTIAEAAKADGFDLILDGTNASDDEGDRPGMRALKELSVRSPLRECGLTKPEIRRLSKKAGLFTWDKPAYACLATRIPTGEVITAEKLAKTESAEDFLFSLGFTDFRVRMSGNSAKIQLPEGQLDKLMAQRKEILAKLKQYYDSVTLDLEVR